MIPGDIMDKENYQEIFKWKYKYIRYFEIKSNKFMDYLNL